MSSSYGTGMCEKCKKHRYLRMARTGEWLCERCLGFSRRGSQAKGR